MKHLFTPGGRAALATLLTTTPLLAFDFDGTLCEIEAEPDASRTRPANLKLLRSLNRRLPLAIISGRSVLDLTPKLGFTPRYVIGNHGFEGLDRNATGRAVAVVAKWRAQLATAWDEFAGDPGVFVEDKRYSLSLHYRAARNPVRAARRLREVIGALTPAPRVIGGKFIYNLTLNKSAHKGTALLALMKRERARTALFVGDDVTDEFAFAVDAPGVIKVRVGQSRASAADWYVRDLDGVTRLLGWANQTL